MMKIKHERIKELLLYVITLTPVILLLPKVIPNEKSTFWDYMTLASYIFAVIVILWMLKLRKSIKSRNKNQLETKWNEEEESIEQPRNRNTAKKNNKYERMKNLLLFSIIVFPIILLIHSIIPNEKREMFSNYVVLVGLILAVTWTLQAVNVINRLDKNNDNTPNTPGF